MAAEIAAAGIGAGMDILGGVAGWLGGRGRRKRAEGQLNESYDQLGSGIGQRTGFRAGDAMGMYMNSLGPSARRFGAQAEKRFGMNQGRGANAFMGQLVDATKGMAPGLYTQGKQFEQGDLDRDAQIRQAQANIRLQQYLNA